ncbi:MAG: hypothetical protein IKK10_03555 [Clostridia bacterium]|nr:hypothetical protein [Clostridia bacterium]
MKIFKRVVAVVISLLIIFCLNNILLLKSYNSSVLYGSFVQKRACADSIDGEKIIAIGGSATNLGFDSKTFEELSGKPCVNLAVSAGIPLRVYMKAADICSQKGDIVIMPLEYDYYDKDFYNVDEAYVDMVNVDKDLKCKDDLYHSIEYICSTFLRSFTIINDCMLFKVRDKLNTQNTIYIADSVDEYGDFYLHKDRTPVYTRVIIDTEFIYNDVTMNEIASFIDRMEQKGVTVYLTYPVTDIYRIKNYENYADDVQRAVESYIPKANIIGTPMDFAYEEECFFDTAYHLQYEYRKEYTEKLFSIYQNTAE